MYMEMHLSKVLKYAENARATHQCVKAAAQSDITIGKLKYKTRVRENYPTRKCADKKFQTLSFLLQENTEKNGWRILKNNKKTTKYHNNSTYKSMYILSCSSLYITQTRWADYELRDVFYRYRAWTDTQTNRCPDASADVRNSNGISITYQLGDMC